MLILRRLILCVFCVSCVIVLESGVQHRSGTFAQSLTNDAAKLDEQWPNAVDWAIARGTGLDYEVFYLYMEERCKEWEWPKTRCEKAFAELVKAREEHIAQRRREEEKTKREKAERLKKLGY